MPSISGNLKDLHFSKMYSFYELSGRNTDYTPNVATQLQDLNHWKVFQHKGFHFLHLNSLLTNIDEVKLIANKSNATILGISETKLDKTIMDSEHYIEGYDVTLTETVAYSM